MLSSEQHRWFLGCSLLHSLPTKDKSLAPFSSWPGISCHWPSISHAIYILFTFNWQPGISWMRLRMCHWLLGPESSQPQGHEWKVFKLSHSGAFFLNIILWYTVWMEIFRKYIVGNPYIWLQTRFKYTVPTLSTAVAYGSQSLLFRNMTTVNSHLPSCCKSL